MSRLPRDPAPLARLTRGLGLLLALVPGAVSAAEIPLPTIQAPYAFVGDPRFGLQAADDGELYSKQPDVSAPMASTTKSMSMYLVSREVTDGLLDLNDTVTLSSNALIPRCHGHSALSGPGVPVTGDQYTLRDMLLALMIDSASEGTLGAAEYLASVLDGGLPDGAAREAAFVTLMNERAADLGLSGTIFANPYGGDHLHRGSCSQGDAVVHQTTAREISRWFHAAMADETFRTLNGYRGNLTINEVNGAKSHSLFWAPGYPGVTGQKGGSNDSCESCLVVEARRIGRDLDASYLQSVAGSGDGTSLLDYGYAVTFNPDMVAWSPKWGPVKDQALANVGSTRAVSAILTEGGQVDLITWEVDVEAGTLTEITNGFSGPCAPDDFKLRTGGGVSRGASINGVTHSQKGFASLATVDSGNGGRGGGGHHGAGGFDLGSPWKPVAIDVEHLGGGSLLLAVETPHGVQLSSWGMPACGKVFIRDSQAVAGGHDPQLQVLADGMVALGLMTESDGLQVTTWTVDIATGAISPAPIDTAWIGDARDVHDLAGGATTDGGRIVAVMGTGLTSLAVVGWPVSSTGMIGVPSRVNVSNARGPSITRVTGFDEDTNDVYAVAMIRTPGTGGTVGVVALAVNAADQLSVVGRDAGATLGTVDGGLTAIESYREGGVMVLDKTSRSNEVTRMSTWSLDVDAVGAPTSSLDVNFVVQSETSPSVGRPEIDRLPPGLAEGDFLIAQEDFFEVDEPLQLEVYRSGPR